MAKPSSLAPVRVTARIDRAGGDASDVLELAVAGTAQRWPMPSGEDARTARAAEWLVNNNAAVARRFRQDSETTLRWRFDSSAGRERNHDRTLNRVLPLLLPRRVQDSLYPFQRRGVAFLLWHSRAVLADDMGLGKTVQVIAALRRLYRFGRLDSCLVVAPRTLLRNWAAELSRWAPELIAKRLGRRGGEFSSFDWRGALVGAHVILASYEEVRDLSCHLSGAPPDLIVADEAHRLRKAQSQVSQAIRELEAPRFWMLTGTPVERDAGDLACLLSLLEPRLFSIDDDRLGLDALQSRVRPYLLRRTKESVLPELPQASEHTIECELLPSQRAAYDEAIRAAASRPQRDHLALFSTLRGICDAEPSTGDSAKLNHAIRLISEAARTKRKTVVFSYTIDPLRELHRRLRKSGLISELLVGEQSLEARARAVAKFKEDPQCVALAASMRVASEGLTLTEATQVVFVNRWWNPSTNSQAVDRVVRIGQTQEVDVYYLVARNTVEDRLGPLLERKQMTFDQLIGVLKRNPNTVSDLMDI